MYTLGIHETTNMNCGDLLLTSIRLAGISLDNHQDVCVGESKIDEDEVRERALTTKVYWE